MNFKKEEFIKQETQLSLQLKTISLRPLSQCYTQKYPRIINHIKIRDLAGSQFVVELKNNKIKTQGFNSLSEIQPWLLVSYLENKIDMHQFDQDKKVSAPKQVLIDKVIEGITKKEISKKKKPQRKRKAQ